MPCVIYPIDANHQPVSTRNSSKSFQQEDERRGFFFCVVHWTAFWGIKRCLVAGADDARSPFKEKGERCSIFLFVLRRPFDIHPPSSSCARRPRRKRWAHTNTKKVATRCELWTGDLASRKPLPRQTSAPKEKRIKKSMHCASVVRCTPSSCSTRLCESFPFRISPVSLSNLLPSAIHQTNG